MRASQIMSGVVQGDSWTTSTRKGVLREHWTRKQHTLIQKEKFVNILAPEAADVCRVRTAVPRFTFTRGWDGTPHPRPR